MESKKMTYNTSAVIFSVIGIAILAGLISAISLNIGRGTLVSLEKWRVEIPIEDDTYRLSAQYDKELYHIRSLVVGKKCKGRSEIGAVVRKKGKNDFVVATAQVKGATYYFVTAQKGCLSRSEWGASEANAALDGAIWAFAGAFADLRNTENKLAR